MEQIYRNWTMHHMIGHPLLAIFTAIGLTGIGHWVHDVTLPEHDHDDTA